MFDGISKTIELVNALLPELVETIPVSFEQKVIKTKLSRSPKHKNQRRHLYNSLPCTGCLLSLSGGCFE